MVQKSPIVEVVKKISPAIVSITISKDLPKIRKYYIQPFDDFLGPYGQPIPQYRREGSQKVKIGGGSGFFVSPEGIILTNRHVIVSPNVDYTITTTDEKEYQAEILARDPINDVAIIKVKKAKGRKFPTLELGDSSKAELGEDVIAIGNALGAFRNTVSTGVVSGLSRFITAHDGFSGQAASLRGLIQTDAAINLGNSGGALIDAWGRLIGINTAIVSRSGGSIGIGFAIPANMALNIARNLINSGGVPRGMLGLFPTNLDRDMADAFGLETTKGALVNQVQQDSPAARAGIQHGDIIIQVDDIEIESAQQLRLRVSQMLPGSEVMVTLIRRGKTMQLPVKLGSLNGVAENTPAMQDSVYAMRLSRVDQDVRKRFSIPDGIAGVLVEEVAADSPFAGKLEQLTVILEVNGQSVDSPAAVEAQLKPGMNRLYIWAGGQKGFIVMRL